MLLALTTCSLRQHPRIQTHRPQKQIRVIDLALRNFRRQVLGCNDIIQHPITTINT